MPFQVLRHIKNRASHMAYGSVLYNWSLNGDIPDRLAVRPVDAWAGCKDKGHGLCNGALCFHGLQVPLSSDSWELDDAPPALITHMHSFTWLRDLRALCGERGMGAVARTHAKMMIQSWAEHHPRWDAVAWDAGVVGQRLAMWLSTYDFYSAVEFLGPDEELFEDIFFESCMRQARHLSRVIEHGSSQKNNGVDAFWAAKGLLYAGVAFEGCEAWRDQALAEIEAQLDTQIAGDGAHRSASPLRLLQVLQILLDVKMVLGAAGHPLPERIQHAIDRMGPALRFFRYHDKGLSLFHGAQERDAEHIDCVLRQAGVRGKALSSLPSIGFERLTQGRTTILMDCAADRAESVHCAPLAMEMSYGRDRLFVNCGTHPTDADWQSALRGAPAHTGLTLDARNVCEKHSARMARFKGRTDTPAVRREDTKDTIFIEASHDGYVPVNGFTHTRRVYVSDQGHDIRGEDVLSSEIPPAHPVAAAVRFHLHPKVMISLIRDGQEALLRLPGGVGWRFHHQGGALSLEDSVYMGNGAAPRKTKQLVIYGYITDMKAQIQWAFQREG